MKKIVGIENLDYTNKNGKRVTGCVLHYLDVEKLENVEGYRVGNAYFKGECEFALGECVEIYYNQFGSPAKVVKCNEKEEKVNGKCSSTEQ